MFFIAAAAGSAGCWWAWEIPGTSTPPPGTTWALWPWTVLADREGFRFNKLRFRAWTGQWKVGDRQVLVMKPQTYMNLSGESVGEAARFYKIPADHVLVI